MRQSAGTPYGGSKEWTSLVHKFETGEIQIAPNQLGQVMPDWQLPKFVALLGHPEKKAVSMIDKVVAAELGHGSHSCRGIDEDGNDCLIATSDQFGIINRVKQLTNLPNRNLGCLALYVRQSLCSN